MLQLFNFSNSYFRLKKHFHFHTPFSLLLPSCCFSWHKKNSKLMRFFAQSKKLYTVIVVHHHESIKNYFLFLSFSFKCTVHRLLETQITINMQKFECWWWKMKVVSFHSHSHYFCVDFCNVWYEEGYEEEPKKEIRVAFH